MFRSMFSKMSLLIFSPSIFVSFAHADALYVCNTADFDADTVTGQSLSVTVSDRGMVQEIKKNKGSWYSDKGRVTHPKVLSKNKKRTVYECEFHDDSWEGRFIVFGDGKKLKRAQFNFRDAEAGQINNDLKCTFVPDDLL